MMRGNQSAIVAILAPLLLIFSACSARYTAPIIDARGVRFRIHAPAAKTVSIVGSFNRWDRERDRLDGPDKDGWWGITLPLPDGRHEYLFLIDGRIWLADPYAQATADDGLGGRNSVLYVER